jgi:14-3-3 protein epsilon
MIDNKLDKELYLAIISEKCHRYEDMYTNIEHIITNTNEFTDQDQFNLISSAFKHNLSNLRESINKLNFLEYTSSKEQSPKSQYIIEYKTTLINKLITFCNGVIDLIDKHILPKSSSADSLTFFYTLKADYLRYIAENILDENAQKTISDQALNTYNTALSKSDILAYTNVNKLNLMLHLTVFYYEILHNTNKAHQLAVETLNNAKQLIKVYSEHDEQYRDSFTLISLLESNIRMWDIEME